MKTLATPILLIALATGSWGILAQERELPVNASISREALRSVTKGTDDRFTGNARITSLFPANAPSRVTGGQVTFESDARTAWHAHPVGQTLIVTAGTGRIQFWGGVIQEIRTGDVVSIPPTTKHWHGASPGTSMTHIAIQEMLDGSSVTWSDHVTDEEYDVTACE